MLYKYVAIAVAVLVLCVGVWNVSGGYHENKFNQERVAILNKQIEDKKHDDSLKSEIGRVLQEGLRESREQIAKSTQQAVNEIRTDPVYRSCRITDGVRKSYRDAIKQQAG
jgi:type VI protein secretion system component VasK